MTVLVETVGRILAAKEGRAVCTRKTSALIEDPEQVFAIAPIKMVAEEIVHAIAFGSPNKKPRIVTRWNPLSRDAGDLEAFATDLAAYIDGALDAGRLPRVWVPHQSALTVLELLGHRYRTNKTATDKLRRMGELCWALAEETRMPGQQVVAVACDLLKSHVLTGQPPIKDGHLGALLAWVEPVPGIDPAAEADRRALVPASGVLVRGDDDEVERLRRIAKRGGRRGEDAQRNIADILERGAKTEWRLLCAARRAFWRLGLPGTAMAALAEDSKQRASFFFRKSIGPRTSPHALARELEMHEYAADLLEDAEHRSDAAVRERARRKGRAIDFEVFDIVQPRKGCKPCTLQMCTRQEAMRVRVGTQLQTIDQSLVGRVVGVGETPDGASTVSVLLSKGIRSRPERGSRRDWVDTVVFDRFAMEKNLHLVHRAMQDNKVELVYGSNVAAGAAAAPTTDFLAVAERLRR